MTLEDLKKQVDSATEYAKEVGEPLNKIRVSLQIDGPDRESVCAMEEIELHYDNNGQASGCVLVGEFSFKES